MKHDNNLKIHELIEKLESLLAFAKDMPETESVKRPPPPPKKVIDTYIQTESNAVESGITFSSKTKIAIELMRRENLSVAKAAARVGISPAAIYGSKEHFKLKDELEKQRREANWKFTDFPDIAPDDENDEKPVINLSGCDWFTDTAEQINMPRDGLINQLVELFHELDRGATLDEILSDYFEHEHHKYFSSLTLSKIKQQLMIEKDKIMPHST